MEMQCSVLARITFIPSQIHRCFVAGSGDRAANGTQTPLQTEMWDLGSPGQTDSEKARTTHTNTQRVGKGVPRENPTREKRETDSRV